MDQGGIGGSASLGVDVGDPFLLKSMTMQCFLGSGCDHTYGLWRFSVKVAEPDAAKSEKCVWLTACGFRFEATSLAGPALATEFMRSKGWSPLDRSAVFQARHLPVKTTQPCL